MARAVARAKVAKAKDEDEALTAPRGLRGCIVQKKDKGKNANQSTGNPNTTPAETSEPSGGLSNTRPTTRSQMQAQREQGTEHANEDGDQSNARKYSRFMCMARKLQKKGFEVTCPGEF